MFESRKNGTKTYLKPSKSERKKKTFDCSSLNFIPKGKKIYIRRSSLSSRLHLPIKRENHNHS